MYRVQPKVFLIGQSHINHKELDRYLDHIGATEYEMDPVATDLEILPEIYGRICYKSFQPGLNKNVTKIREGNEEYLKNILTSKHGAVLEHSMVNFVFTDVSRVFTHELVRHRIGVAISQESLRYVRLNDLGLWLPSVIEKDEEAVKMFENAFEYLGDLQIKLAEHFKLDSDEQLPFKIKKIITSAIRRVAPIGLATTIGWSANVRALRWIIELRTDPSAEEEIRLVFGQVGRMMKENFPNLFQDMEETIEDGLSCFKTVNKKV